MKEYFFGYGADKHNEMISAIIGEDPEWLTNATLNDYQLCIQTLDDIPNSGANPRAILEKAWGNKFRSYAIRKHKGEKVEGSVFRLNSSQRKLIDDWELVSEGWQESVIVTVVGNDGRKYTAHTQSLRQGNNHGEGQISSSYKLWLMPRVRLLALARKIRKS